MRIAFAVTTMLAACGDPAAEPDAAIADADLRPTEWQVDSTSASVPCEDDAPAEIHLLPRRLDTDEPVVPELGLTCAPLETCTYGWCLYCEQALTFRAPMGGGAGTVIYTVETSTGTCLSRYDATFEEHS